MRLVNLVSATLLILLLSACIVPEDFTLNMTAGPSDVSFSYDGTIVVINVFAARNEEKAKNKADMMKVFDENFRDEVVKNNGQYKSEYDLNGRMGVETQLSLPYSKLRDRNLYNLIKTTHRGNGVFEFNSVLIKPGDQNHLKSIGLDIDDISGDIAFTPREGVKVLEHNAESEPGLFSKAYKWDLEMGRGETVHIVVEVESIKREIERKKKEKQKAAEAARKARLEQLQKINTAYENDLILYYAGVRRARLNSENIYRNIRYINPVITAYVNPKYKKASVHDRIKINVQAWIENNSQFDVGIDDHFVAIKDKSGEIVLTDWFSISRKHHLDPKEKHKFNENVYPLNHTNKDQETINKLCELILSGDYEICIYPDTLSLSHKGLTPDGNALLPQKPSPDRRLAELYDLEKSMFVMNSEIENKVTAKLVAEGRLEPLPTVPDKFPVQGPWIKPSAAPSAVAHAGKKASSPQKTPTPAVPPHTKKKDTPKAVQKENPQKERPSFNRVTPWVDPVSKIEFVWIPGGCFQMGSPKTEKGHDEDEEPIHEVCVDGFWMSKYEITNAQYQQFNPRHRPKPFEGRSLDSSRQPVVYVSWIDANSYAAWLTQKHAGKRGYRLPSEAEWEYAARAGSTTSRFWGDDPNQAYQFANVADKQYRSISLFDSTHKCDDGYAVSAPIGQYKPNQFGLHDMLGNVWEWCEDWHHDNAYQHHEKQNPLFSKDTGTKVLRGGSWRYGPKIVRCAQRAANKPTDRQANIGFRLVMLEGETPSSTSVNDGSTAQTSAPKENGLEKIKDGVKAVDSFLKAIVGE